MAALTQFSYLAADTIVNGCATSHLAPTDPADREWALRDVGACTGLLESDPAQGLLPGLPSAGPDGHLSAGLVDTCRECGARALELLGQLQEQQTLHQAQPSLVRGPLQGILQLGQVRAAAMALGVGWGP